MLREGFFLFFKHRAERLADGGGGSDDGAEPERGVPEEVKCDGPAHVSGAADDGEGLPVVHSGGPGPGARGDRGFRDGVVGEDGT